MERRRIVPLALGVLAVLSSLAVLTFDIIFLVELIHASSSTRLRTAAIIASVLSGILLLLLLCLFCRQILYRNAHIQDSGVGRHHTYWLAGTSGAIGIFSAVASALLFGVMRNRVMALVKRATSTDAPTGGMVTGAFILWAVALLSQAFFIICVVIIQRKDFQHQIRPYDPETEPQNLPQMEKTPQRRALNAMEREEQHGSHSMDSKSPPSSSGRSRANSDAKSSLRSSSSQVVRSVSSRTRLVQNGSRNVPKLPIESGLWERSRSVEEGLDSWDTSAVDAQAQQAVESASTSPPRFLETIPASPTTSRSPSPGFPLDLQPPKSRKRRSRSYSPANSFQDRARTPRSSTPTESTVEAHIHPLFRSDSPTPPPSATRGTIVTAAPGAGQVLSDRASIRSLKRMRSGSLPSSPLGRSGSLESMHRAMERDEWERLQEAGKVAGGDRQLTPPIPDFIMNGTPRGSMNAFHVRRKTQPMAADLEMRERDASPSETMT